MRNLIDSGTTLTLTNTTGSTIPGGSLVDVGSKVAMVAADIPVGAAGTVELKGKYSYAKKSGDTFAQGAAVYFDATANDLTSTATSNTLAGIAALAALSADTVMTVVINP